MKLNEAKKIVMDVILEASVVKALFCVHKRCRCCIDGYGLYY
jgi:hypothetical protein